MNRRTVCSLFMGTLAGAAWAGRMVPALAENAKSPNGFIELTGVWARANGPTERTVYLDIINHGTTDDRLVGVSAADAKECALEKTRWRGLTMKTAPVESINIPAMARTQLKPGGIYIHAYHLTLSEDDRGPLTLTLNFANGGAVEVKAELSVRALGPPR